MLGNERAVQGVSLNEALREADIHPHGVRLDAPDLSHHSHSLAVTVRAPGGAAQFHVMFNAYWEALTFELPRPGSGVHAWRRWIDTYRDAPDDVCEEALAPSVDGGRYTVQSRSLVALFALQHDPASP
jgi:glycogen operon protein